MEVIITITGLNKDINIGDIIRINVDFFKVLSKANCEIDGRQGQQMLCQLVEMK